jgi:hypothetical protein
MADTNLEMSERNDTMAANRGVVAVVELARRDSARRPIRRRPDEGYGVAGGSIFNGFINAARASARRSRVLRAYIAGIEDTLGCSKGFRFL